MSEPFSIDADKSCPRLTQFSIDAANINLPAPRIFTPNIPSSDGLSPNAVDAVKTIAALKA